MKAVEEVEAHIADAVTKGAKMVLGGKRAPRRHETGAAVSSSRPCLTNVTTGIVITKEETFGPVAPLYRSESGTYVANMTIL